MTMLSIQANPVAGDVGFATPFFALGWTRNVEWVESEGVRLLLDGFFGLDGDFVRGGEKIDARVLKRVVHLYRSQGADFLQKLRGSFALALWDSSHNRLLLAIDPFGTRPLYYWQADGVFAFAPRISSLVIRPEIPRRINPDSIYFFLNHSFIPAPFTIYQGIKRLEPGQCLLWQNGVASLRHYWDMVYIEDKNLDEGSSAELISDSVEESVRFLLRNELCSADQLGAFLSGGTDSSTILGLMSRVAGRRVKSFSVGFDEERYNEIRYARLAASRFNSDAHEYFVHPREALEALPELAHEYDEPFGNSSAIPTYFCLKAARDDGVKVMFAGDGGDELFAGNERYLTEKVFSLYQRVPSWLRKGTDFAAEHLPSVYPLRKVRNYIDKANLPTADRFFSYQLYFRENAIRFFTDDFRESLDLDFPLRVPRLHYERAGNASELNRLLYMDLKLAIADNDLFKVNRMAESHGVQVRYPFLDIQVAAVSGKIPAGLKLKSWEKRYIFKKAFENLLPVEILRKKKHGFGLPTGDWLRNNPGFRELAHSLLLDQRSMQRGYFKRKSVEDLLINHDKEPSGYYGSHIWNFMMLELWHRSHFDRT
jgi:asparagine synthase (glutamine-hydrolysing)